MLRILLSVSIALAVTACSRSGKPEKADRPESLDIGTLVCIDSGFVTSLPAGRAPAQCPLLVVGTGPDDTLVVIGPSSQSHRLPAKYFRKLGPVAAVRGLAGATEFPVDRMVPPPANPGVLIPTSDFGLLVAAAEGKVDTLYPEAWPAMTGEARDCMGWESCLDSLQTSPYFGLLQGPFLPPWRLAQASYPAWKFDSDSASIQPFEKESTLKESTDKANPDSFRILTAAKPMPSEARGRPWLFVHGVGQSGGDVWIWRTEGSGPVTLEVPFMHQSEIVEVEAEDWRPDKASILKVRTVTYEGDGSSSTLYLLLPGTTDSGRPRLGVMGLSGSSGEPGGSEVEVAWWMESPRVYRATAQWANETGRGESHDLQVEAFQFTAEGGFADARDTSNRLVMFASPTARTRAQAWIDSLATSRPDSREARLRPLPRLTATGILWQPGAVAPDSKSAADWSKWHRSGMATSIPSSSRR